jgi:hypothetical protein
MTLLCLAAQAARAEDPPLQIAVLAFTGPGTPADSLAFDAEHFAQSLRAPGLRVITAREMSTLLGMDRQRQLLGCDAASSSCLAELASALGAAAVVVGDVGRFQDTWQLNVKVLSGSDARVIASRSARVGTELAVLDALSAIGRALAAAVLADHHRPVPEALTRAPAAVKPWGWLPLGLGVAAGAAGGVLFGLSRADAAALTGPGTMLSATDANALRDSGRTRQTLGVALLIASGVALLTGAGLFLFGQDPIVLTLAPGPDGFAFALAGRLP